MSIDFKSFVADRNHQTFRDSQYLMKENFTEPSATSLDFLEWLYLKNPYESAKGFIAYEGKKPVSQLFLTYQQCLYEGCLQKVAVASNACTMASHRNQGLFHTIFLLLVEEAKQQKIPFIWAYPNPNSLRGFLKTGFVVVKESSLEIIPVSYFGILRELVHKEKFSVLAETEDVPFGKQYLNNFKILTKEDALHSKGLSDRDALSEFWHVPLTKEQLEWRYFQAPGRKYQVLEHKKTSVMLILRIIRLFGMKTALIMKSTAKDVAECNMVLGDVKKDLKGEVNFLTTLPSEISQPGINQVFKSRFLVPKKFSPRKFPLAIYPVADKSLLLKKFDFVLGDYEAL